MGDGRRINLIAVTEDFSGYVAEEPLGNWPVVDLGERIQAITDPPDGPAAPNTLQLVIDEGVGRSFFVGLNEQSNGSPRLVISLDDLRVMMELDGHDPLFLWRFARADNELHLNTEVMSWSILDNYEVYRKNDRSYYMTDDKPFNFISIEVATGLSLRVEAQKRTDAHEVRSFEGRSFIEVLSLHGVDTSPIYFTHPRYPLNELLVELSEGNIWIGSERTQEPNLSVLQASVKEAVAYWTWLATQRYPRQSRIKRQGQDLYINISFNDVDTWLEVISGEALDDQEASWVTTDIVDDGHVMLLLHAPGARDLLAPDNRADRALLRALLPIVANIEGDDTESAVDEIAPLGQKRMLRVVEGHRVLMDPGALPAVRMVQQAETAVILDELSRWLGTQGVAQGPLAEDKRTEVLQKVVGHYFDMIVDQVALLSPEGLIEQLVLRDEALLHEEATSQANLPARIACFGESSDLVKDLAKDHKRRVEAALASRFLIEYAAATPPSGQEPLTLETYDTLLAISAELISRAMLSDAIHFGFAECQLAVLGSGRLGVSRGDRYQAGTQAMVDALAETMRKVALEPQFSKPSKAPVAPTAPMESAVREEFGFTLTELVEGIAELVAVGRERNLPEPYSLPRQEVEAHLQAALGWPEDRSGAFIDRLTLRPRTRFLSVGTDSYPWRYNREWSYLRRPLVEIQTSEGTTLVWGPRRLWSAGGYWMDLIYSGRLRAQGRALKSLMGSVRQKQNRLFEDRVAERLRVGGCDCAESSVSKIGGQKLLSSDGDDLGDIDAIGACITRKVLIVAEAKDFELARNPAELANEAESLIHGDKSAIFKLERRAQWVRKHLRAVLQELGIPGAVAGWTVSPVVVTSRDLISPRVLPSLIPVVAFDDLHDWVSRALASPSSRRKRKGR